MATIDTRRGIQVPPPGTATQGAFSTPAEFTAPWGPPQAPQEVGELRRHVDPAEAAGRRVVEQYPNTLRRLSE